MTHRHIPIRSGLRTSRALAAVSLFAAGPAQARDGERADVVDWHAFDPPSATVLTPEEALETFRLPPGFRIELVAAEPLVEDPVAAAWDADGRLWTAEMRAYMHDAEGTGENQGIDRVVVLEDVNGDGRMDRSTVFLDGLVMPRSIIHLEGGVIIAEPPRLWFCQDTTGDLVCDRKVEIYRETCMACHQIHGRGMRGLAPPLVGSRRVLEDEEGLVRIVLHGMSGPLTDADGEEWNLVMPGLWSNPQKTDESIAAVLSYVRRE